VVSKFAASRQILKPQNNFQIGSKLSHHRTCLLTSLHEVEQYPAETRLLLAKINARMN
jgi:hypothetical protein